jgi:acetylornithine deacetylase/succinyl-diaminopimelate desuccinylase-like protein
MSAVLTPERVRHALESLWRTSALPSLAEYIRIPCCSPLFDPDWQRNGHLERAMAHVAAWVRSRPIAGLRVETLRLAGRTPLLLLEAPGSRAGSVLVYGHLDKQPPMEGWRPGLGPWEPVLLDGKLYGRGGGDDGYAAYAATLALEVLDAQGIEHPSVMVLIEASEESGSTDLEAHLEELAPRIGRPELVLCLDAGCGDYERLWVTTSLRGSVVLDLEVQVLAEPVHSGDAGGVVPDSFRLVRRLLSRLEDEETGSLLSELCCEVPAERVRQAQDLARISAAGLAQRMPIVPGLRLMGEDEPERLLNRTWRPSLTITAADGFPSLDQASNVVRRRTAVRLSLRLPPTLDAAAAAATIERALAVDPPEGAIVRATTRSAASGWGAHATAPWLDAVLARASSAFFGRRHACAGDGGTIPFAHLLARRCPDAQFLVTGVLGPGSSAHGPNEFLHLATAERLTACLALVLANCPALVQAARSSPSAP